MRCITSRPSCAVTAFLTAAISAQSYQLLAPEGATGPFRRLVAGNFVPDVGTKRMDLAVLARTSAWLVFRPNTWGSYHPWGSESSVEDLALVARSSPATDGLLAVGGPTPLLLTYANGFAATPLSVTGWSGIRTIATMREGSADNSLVLGLNRTKDSIRIGRLTWTPTPAFTQLTNGAIATEGAAGALAWTDFNADGVYEAAVGSVSGASLYTASGLRSALISLPNVRHHLTRARCGGRDRLLWVSKGTTTSAWTACLLDSSGLVGPIELQLPCPETVPNGPLEVLSAEGSQASMQSDRVVLGYRFGTGRCMTMVFRIDLQQVLADPQQYGPATDMFINPGAPSILSDVDGDHQAEVVSTQTSPLGIGIRLPITANVIGDGTHWQGFTLGQPSSAPNIPSFSLTFGATGERLDLTVYRRSWVNNGPGTVSVWSHTNYILAPNAGSNVVTIPIALPAIGGTYGAFYLEATYTNLTTDSASSQMLLLSPAMFNGSAALPIENYLMTHYEASDPGAFIRDRDTNFIKAPVRLKIPNPGTLPPVD